jgi:hypothetical protein
MSTTKPKRQRVKDGDILAIKIGHELYAFGRVIDGAIAVYNYTSEDMNKLPDIEDRYFLFIVTVYSNVLSSGQWPKVGHDGASLVRPNYYMRDEVSGEYSIYNTKDQSETPSNEACCKGMERLAVWHKEIVEERIRDTLQNEKTIWLNDEKWTPYPVKFLADGTATMVADKAIK